MNNVNKDNVALEDRRRLPTDSARGERPSPANARNGLRLPDNQATQAKPAPTISRTHLFRRNVIAGGAGKFISGLLTFISVPLLLKILGRDGYGLFVSITAVAGWAGLGMFGIGKGLMNVLIESRTRDDVVHARRMVASLWLGLLIILGALALGLASIFSVVPWNAVFAINNAVLGHKVKTAVALTMASMLINLLLSPTSTIQSAYQEETKGASWAVIRSAANLAAILTAWRLGLHIVGVSLLTGVGSVAVSIAYVWWMFAVDKPFLMPRWGDPSVSFFFKVLPDSFSFFLIDIAAVLAFQFDKFVLLHYGGPGQVARFEVATRPFLLASMSLGLLLTPLWPAIGEAVHRGDPRWAKKVVLKVAYSSAALMAVLALVMVAAGGLIVRLWTGRTDVTPGALLFGMIGAYFVVKAWTDTQTVVLYGLGGQRRMLWVALIHGATTLVLSLVLGRLYGIYGVASASLLGFLLTASWYVTLQTKRTLDSLDSTKCLGESVLT